MQIEQTIECVRCGLTREELLTQEEREKILAAVGPIHRYCAQCGKTTGWISSGRSPEGAKKLPLHQSPNQIGDGNNAKGPTVKGQERMATQAERDHVNSLSDDKAQGCSDDQT